MDKSRSGPHRGLCRVSDLRPEPVRWLWPGRLALGKLALLEGDPGLGKSLVTLDFCARLSRGRPLPDGSATPGPANAVVLNAEDGAADTVRSRLAALGADLDRVFVPAALEAGGESLRLPSQLARLEEALNSTGARLAVIDPLLAFLDRSVAAGNDQSIRQALMPLAGLAARLDCAVLLVRHLNKRGGQHAVYRGGGAIGLLGACRSAWLVGRDPGHAGQCVLAQVKNNLAPPQASLAYRVEEQGDGVACLSWLGASPWSAEQLLSGQPHGSAEAQARAFLLLALEGGPRPVREVRAEARRQGLPAGALRRASEELAVTSRRVTRGGRRESYWLLPGQELAERAWPPVPDPWPWLALLRERYPAAAPLDEE
jgi:putative DNA primase/helicase